MPRAATSRPLFDSATSRPSGAVNLLVYVCKSGPAVGEPDLQAAFRTKGEAIAFLTNVHGLSVAEQRILANSGSLRLNAYRHGSQQCSIQSARMPAAEAAKALSGELYQS